MKKKPGIISRLFGGASVYGDAIFVINTHQARVADNLLNGAIRYNFTKLNIMYEFYEGFVSGDCLVLCIATTRIDDVIDAVLRVCQNTLCKCTYAVFDGTKYRTLKNTACGSCIMQSRGTTLTVYNTGGGSFDHIKIRPLMMVGESLDWDRVRRRNASDKTEIVVNDDLMTRVLETKKMEENNYDK